MKRGEKREISFRGGAIWSCQAVGAKDLPKKKKSIKVGNFKTLIHGRVL